MVSKFSNVSIGRTLICVDMTIVCCSIFLPFEEPGSSVSRARIPIIVYGIMVSFIGSFMADQIINTNRQATQFSSSRRSGKRSPTGINSEARRGVTVIDGMGWYFKHDMKILMVCCRRIESVTIFSA